MSRAGAQLDTLTDLPPGVAGHLTSCTSCLADRRVAWLRKREATGVVAAAPARRGRVLLWLAVLVATIAAALFVLSRNGFFRNP